MRAENENWGDTVRNHLFDQRSAVMVHWLILLNVVIFILGFFFQVDIPRNIYPPVHLDLIQLYGAYSEYTCFHEGELWRLLTYQFLHANLGHIMFNMIALWFFGPVVEERFGHWRTGAGLFAGPAKKAEGTHRGHGRGEPAGRGE